MATSVQLQQGPVVVRRAGDRVTLADGSGGFATRETLHVDQARELIALLDTALRPGSAGGPVGDVQTARGRLFVKRSGAAVSLSHDPREHASWNARGCSTRCWHCATRSLWPQERTRTRSPATRRPKREALSSRRSLSEIGRRTTVRWLTTLEGVG